LQNYDCCRGSSGDVVVRVSIGLVVVVVAAAVSLGEASAQTYSSSSVEGPPIPPLNVGAPPAQQHSNPAYSAPANSPPPRRTVAQNAAPFRDTAPRPPADIGGGAASADVTGSIRAPGAATMPAPDRATVVAALPPDEQPEAGPAIDLPPQFRRQLVDYPTSEPAGTVIIDTPHTYLYLVLGGGKALRYGVGVGREGFTWSGGERISRMSEWPDWHPPKEMIERQPYLPRFMAGGPGNPLGARAFYLGSTVYRIHGTNQPSTIGHFVSSGCIRLTNEDVEDLYSRVNLGTRVVVLSGSMPNSAAAQSPIVR
jgi:lipoprotein-anchoring transpeptidase ErfK/SrfK